MSESLLAVVSILAGAVAAVTGFGIGSLLTPVLAISVDTKVAVAVVALPHVVGTAIRLWLLDARRIDRRVFWSFGLTSAAGGLAGALLHEWASSQWLSAVFGLLLLFVAASELAGLSAYMRFTGPMAWAAGAFSGLLGGLVGNQGGVRSAALLGFDLPKHALVATATAVALLVDGARVPVYLMTHGRAMIEMWPSMAIAAAGVVAGTFLGNRVLHTIPESVFRRVLAILLAVLGAAMLWRGTA
jgi:uncharacterized membrane protein YfcA